MWALLYFLSRLLVFFSYLINLQFYFKSQFIALLTEIPNILNCLGEYLVTGLRKTLDIQNMCVGLLSGLCAHHSQISTHRIYSW